MIQRGRRAAEGASLPSGVSKNGAAAYLKRDRQCGERVTVSSRGAFSGHEWAAWHPPVRLIGSWEANYTPIASTITNRRLK